jgi:hypothetical protein
MHSSKRFTVVLALLAAVACAESADTWDDDGGAGNDGSANPAPNPATCPPCVTDNDCNGGGVCSQIGGDTYCAKTCPAGNECDGTHTCTTATTATGDEAKVCVPNNDACGTAPQPPSGGGNPPANACPGLADPSTKASCTSCTQYKQSCQPNGCYGGWWCNEQSMKCQAPPSNCGSDGGSIFDGSVQTLDGGVTSTIGANGGTESTLYFAIIGDTRPAVIDDTSGYPTTVITKIWSDVDSLSPMPPFVVTTGDYMFASTSGTQQAPQLKLYTGARAKYSGVDFPAMGNHECTGATASNCASSTSTNMSEFMSQLLGPISKTKPYYSINVNSPTNAWTAKLVFVAANAWDSTQASWLSSTLAQSTTYTFIIRHESATASTAPGVSPSEQIMKSYSYTLSIVGHAHTYSHPSTKEVLFGNGGAPLTSGNYGFGLITQRSDGAIMVDSYDYSTMKADSSFHFVVKPDGTPTL